MTDFAAARRSVDLAHAHQFAVRAGRMSEDEAERWTKMVTAAQSDPTFFSIITLVIVAGTRGSR